jgi:hypothetical protein
MRLLYGRGGVVVHYAGDVRLERHPSRGIECLGRFPGFDLENGIHVVAIGDRKPVRVVRPHVFCFPQYRAKQKIILLIDLPLANDRV